MTLPPPKTFDDIPEQLIAAWQHLGAELNERKLESMRQCWRDNERYVFVHDLRGLIAEKIPAEQLPGWTEAILQLLDDNPEQVSRHSWFLLGGLIFFLSPADYLGHPLLQQLLQDKDHSMVRAWLHNSARLSAEQRQALVDRLQHITDPFIQREAVQMLCQTRKLSDAEVQERDRLLLTVLPNLDKRAFKYPEHERFYAQTAQQVVRGLRDPELLLLLAERGNAALRKAAVGKLAEQQSREKGLLPEHLERVQTLLRDHPQELAEVGAYFDDHRLLAILWDASPKPEVRHEVVDGLFRQLEQPAALDLLRRFFAEDPSPVLERFWREDEYWSSDAGLELPALEALWQLQLPALQALFIKVLAYRLQSDTDTPYGDFYYEYDGPADLDEDPAAASAWQQQLAQRIGTLVCAALQAHPEQVTDLKPAWLAHLVPYINTEELVRLLTPHLQPLVAKSKPLQRAMPSGLAQVPPALLSELGWLDDKRKGVRDTGLEALLASTHETAAAYLQQLQQAKKTSDADKERILDRLVQLGAAVDRPEPAEADLSELQAKAAKAKIKPQVDKLWSSELAALLAPLDETLGRWMLNLALEAKDGRLPGSAKAILAQLTREQQARLAEHLLQLWLAQNGDSKLRWLNLFVADCGDDRLVDPLFEAFKGWHKRAKPKAVFAIETLARLDTAYALSHVHEVFTKNSYSYALFDAARGALRAAAQRRGIELNDLFDELTPDFGLGAEGLVLDVGPYSYTVTLATDLSLRIRQDQTGKISKSLPKAKVAEDPQLRAVAESRFKFLRSSLKKVAKQQANRLREALICGRSWPYARWRVLFLEHPLLSILGQGLIWQRYDADGKAQASFRISEDRSLIDADDEPLTLTETDRISLWHPVNAESEEIEGWRTHLQDYEIKPLLEQVNQPCLRASAEEIEAGVLKQFSGCNVEQFIAKRFLESWNYEIYDQDGSHVFGYQRQFPLLGVSVKVETGDMDAYSWQGATATIGDFEFYRAEEGRHSKVVLSELPASLIATVLGQAQALWEKRQNAEATA